MSCQPTRDCHLIDMRHFVLLLFLGELKWSIHEYLAAHEVVKMYVRAKTEVRETVNEATGKVSCHCRNGLTYFQI